MHKLPSTYNELMKVGAQDGLVTRRDLARAATAFERAAELVSESGTDRARALRGAGICHRLRGEYATAVGCLNTAFAILDRQIVVPQLELGVTLRDRGMVFLDTRAFAEAEADFRRSRELLRLWPLELAATQGFEGRLHLARGNRQRALQVFLDIDTTLRRLDNRIYELNNLVWLLKVVPRRQRRQYVIRGLRLALHRNQRNSRRAVEVTILGIGGEALYNKMRNRKRCA